MTNSSINSNELYSDILVYEYQDLIVLQPHNTKKSKSLLIDRKTYQIVEVDGYNIGDKEPYSKIFGVIGIIELHTGLYLATIKRRALIGSINGHKIYKLVEVDIINLYQTSNLNTNDRTVKKNLKNDKSLLSMFTNLLNSKQFFFSYTYDISNSLSRKYNFTVIPNQPLWKQWDDRFFSNKTILMRFINESLHQWILPLLRGMVQYFTLVYNNKLFEFLLISRRNKYRDGTRKTRGVDENGNVANSVETEQIVIYDENYYSFVQLRGSVPFLWSQTGYKYTPIPKLSLSKVNLEYFNLHFDIQKKYYDKQVVVNLLSSKGIEQELSETYKLYCNEYVNEYVHYTYFDFHERCKTSFNPINQFIENEIESIQGIKIFNTRSGNVISQQDIYIRVNCLDCLDRTNFVQSYIAKYAMNKVLNDLKISEDDILRKSLDKLFKEAWANNGDAISLQYAGTHALKGEVVRKGKRGLMKDGANSLSRYYIGIFKDTLRQTSLDLFYGNYDVSYDKAFSKGTWNESQQKMIKYCINYFEEKTEDTEDERYIDTWIKINISESNKEDVILLSTKRLFIFNIKSNSNSKNPIFKMTKIPLTSINCIECGFIQDRVNLYGMKIIIGKKYNMSIYSSLDYSQESMMNFIGILVEASQELQHQIEIIEKNVLS